VANAEHVFMPPHRTHDRPFAGIKVCDIAQGISAPYCGMMLAQYGADVVKIEGIAGDWIRNMGGRIKGEHSAQSLAMNRGKRSIALDLKHPKGLEIARRLAREADVVTQNFRLGVIDRLGLGYAAVAKDNPDVIYLSVTGFGTKGPLAERPVTDQIMQGFSGLQSITKDRDGVPLGVGTAIIDYITGIYAYQSVATALFARAMGAGGRHVEISMLQAALGVQAGQFIRQHTQGKQPPAVGVPVGVFHTKEGFISLSSNSPKHFAEACDLLGRDDLKNNPDYDTHQKRVWKSREINEALQVSLLAETAAEWEKRFSALGLMCTRVNGYEDLLRHTQVEAEHLLTWANQTDLGPIPVPNLPGVAPALPDDPRANSPRIGQHTHAVLAELGFDAGAIAGLARDGVIPKTESAAAD
jgi:crotonobetainyl-CoA:carnitine CoA-transferase CaiB-like acyl-CoA transferase